MFTGLIEGAGKLTSVIKKGQEINLSVLPLFELEDCRLGESIAVNGVCLTVTSIKGKIFEVYASAETASRTTLGNLKMGDHVNLERALRLSDRLGGHIVTGHVDGTGKIRQKKQLNMSWLVGVEVDSNISRYTIEKGSVAIDGISLTVNLCRPGYFEVNIIPETGKTTGILSKNIGELINIETDILARYLEKFTTEERTAKENRAASPVNMEMLARFGFGGD